MIPSNPLHVPYGHPTATVFLDESGSRGKDLFTLGGFKVRKSGLLARDLKDIRDQHDFHSEIRFNRLNRRSVKIAMDMIDALLASDAHLVGTVVNPQIHDPFRGGTARWTAHGQIATQLLIGCINRGELVSVLMDGIATPRGCSLADTVRAGVNKRFDATAVVSATCLDSKSNDGLQLADLVASSIRFQRQLAMGRAGADASSVKGMFAARVGMAFGQPGLKDARTDRYRVQTLKARKPRQSAGTVTYLNVSQDAG